MDELALEQVLISIFEFVRFFPANHSTAVHTYQSPPPEVCDSPDSSTLSPLWFLNSCEVICRKADKLQSISVHVTSYI